MVSKGQFVGIDWNRIARLHSQVLTAHVVVVSSLTYSLWRLVGCILICFNVTARCC